MPVKLSIAGDAGELTRAMRVLPSAFERHLVVLGGDCAFP